MYHLSATTTNDDEAADIVMQTVDDIINGASKQSLSKVYSYLLLFSHKIYIHVPN